MVLDNNDEVWYDEAEEVDEAVDLDGTAFPLRLGKNLQGAPLPLSFFCTARTLSYQKRILLAMRRQHPLTPCCGFMATSMPLARECRGLTSKAVYLGMLICALQQNHIFGCSPQAGAHRVDEAALPHKEAHLPSWLHSRQSSGALSHARELRAVPLRDRTERRQL